jgi:hypothetical protein
MDVKDPTRKKKTKDDFVFLTKQIYKSDEITKSDWPCHVLYILEGTEERKFRKTRVVFVCENEWGIALHSTTDGFAKPMSDVFIFALPSNFMNLHILLRIIIAVACMGIRFLKKVPHRMSE